MFRAVARLVAPLLAGPVILCGSGLAPLHAHESVGAHAEAIVHSHFQLHHSGHDTDEPAIESGEHVVWFSAAVLHILPFQLDAPVAPPAAFEPVAPSTSWSVIAFDDSAPPHGPPRGSTPLRAPPVLPV